MIDDTLADMMIEWDEDASATIVLASQGYPEAYPKGLPITGLDKVKTSVVFHAGTKLADGNVLTSGGRVLNVTTTAKTVAQALKTSYQNSELIQFDGKTVRRDIGS